MRTVLAGWFVINIQRLAATFVELADSLVDEYDVVEQANGILA